MRLLNPRNALATLLFVFVIWLAMSGKLSELLSLTKKTAETVAEK